MIGSNSEQTRWALIFVISTIIFYELSVNRKIEIRETHGQTRRLLRAALGSLYDPDDYDRGADRNVLGICQ